MVTRRAALKGGVALGALAASGMRAAGVEPQARNEGSARRLWYRQPAEQWTEALPIGNGRLGAMVFGGVARERLQLNEDTLYAGGPYDPSNPEARLALPRVRELIAAGKYAEAQQLANDRMMGRPMRMPSYQTVGDLLLSLAPSSFAQDYRRELDLDHRAAVLWSMAQVDHRQTEPDVDDVVGPIPVHAHALEHAALHRLAARGSDEESERDEGYRCQR